MKVFTLTVVVLLLVATTFGHAAKVRRGENRVTVDATKASEAEELPKTDATETDTGKKEKEVHKRGILHYGGNLAAAGSLWPKTYASHYGYGLHLPPATGFAAHPLTANHLHAAPTVLKYHGHGFHYKALAAPAAAVSSFGSAWPNYAQLSPAVAHAHPQAATTQPFIIRPGGAVVQSYSVTYPHRKPALAVKPVHSFASFTPVHQVPAVSGVAAVQPAHSFQTVQTVQHVQPVQHFAQPVAAIQPVAAAPSVHHHLTPVHTVQHLPQPQTPPLQTVVQVQQYKPPLHYYNTQQFPSYFQTSFVPPAPAVIPAHPQAPTVAFSPAPAAAFPAFPPSFPNYPEFPNAPSIPILPSPPSVPDVPAVPAIPSLPTVPTIPSIPNFPQPQVPSNSFFPLNVQPPLHQKPPPFGSVNPQVQFPGFGPIAGGNPDFGSADAAPQIPVQPTGNPEPQLPLPQPEATQTPWKPVLYEPPATETGSLGRPSHTLLPPYGSTPTEGYLPPEPSTQSGRYQQEYTIDNSLFDNLSDADIQQIFAQANLAAHRDHHHHTVHNYHTRF